VGAGAGEGAGGDFSCRSLKMTVDEDCALERERNHRPAINATTDATTSQIRR
jgi:hypothetical protein